MGYTIQPVSIITSISTIEIPEGGQASFNVKLAAMPGKTSRSMLSLRKGVPISVLFRAQNLKSAKRIITDGTRSPWQPPWTATPWAVKPPVALSREVRDDRPCTGRRESTVDPAFPAYQIAIEHGGRRNPSGRLGDIPNQADRRPETAVSVTIGHAGGDTGITVASRSPLDFDLVNWERPQTVILSADDRVEVDSRTATFSLTAPDTETIFVTAREENTTTAPINVVIDPISRIEGHLRIEVTVAGGKVTNAWSTATLFRGIETILTGRDPLDAPLITQRLCGVCTYVHDLCSVRAIENAVGVTIPDNARIVRNLMLGAQFLHDHLVHFYHLHGLDWVDITSALGADPKKTADLAWEIAPQNEPVQIDFAAVQARLKGLVATGNLGPFANAYWGHSAYRLTSEENLLVTAHYLEALKMQVSAAKMMAVLGGKNPHPQSTVVGGVTCGGELSSGRLGDFRAYLEAVRVFIDAAYIPDLKVVAGRYPEWTRIGRFGNFMACGEFPQGPRWPDDLFMPEGLIFNGDVANVQPLDPALISEHVAHSWYAGSTDRHPENGETVPNYTGLDKEARYSWLKAPRYGDEPMEVGPLARVLVGYGKGNPVFVEAVDDFLARGRPE